MRRVMFMAAAGAVLLAMAGSADASRRRAVPPLVLTDVSGAPLDDSPLPDTGTWLLVYVRPACPGCESLLDQMNSDERPEPRRIAIVVEGSSDAAAALRARYPNLLGVRWLLDAEGTAGKALEAPSAPAVWGVRNQTIEWDLAGTLRGGPELESVLFSWLKRK